MLTTEVTESDIAIVAQWPYKTVVLINRYVQENNALALSFAIDLG